MDNIAYKSNIYFVIFTFLPQLTDSDIRHCWNVQKWRPHLHPFQESDDFSPWKLILYRLYTGNGNYNLLLLFPFWNKCVICCFYTLFSLTAENNFFRQLRTAFSPVDRLHDSAASFAIILFYFCPCVHTHDTNIIYWWSETINSSQKGRASIAKRGALRTIQSSRVLPCIIWINGLKMLKYGCNVTEKDGKWSVREKAG